MKELEAKFLLQQGTSPKKALRRALQELSWAGFLAHPLEDLAIRDAYYDTSDARLQHAGWSLRVRCENSLHQLTCKQLVSGRGAMFNRREVQQTVVFAAGTVSDVQSLPHGQVRDLLMSHLPIDATLRCLFEITTQRRRYRITSLEYPRTEIELALDRTRIEAGTPLEFVELEAELKQGVPEPLAELGTILERQPGLYRARVSKYQRGLQAAGCPPVSREVPETVTLSPASAWADLGIRHLGTQAQRLKQYEPLAWESVHVEGVHQMRVATRRLRAALKAFGNVLPRREAKALGADVRWLTQNLGGVRDLDVHLEHLDDYARHLHPEDTRLLDSYRRHLLKARRRAHRGLREALASPRGLDLERQLLEFLMLAEQDKLGHEYLSISEVATGYVPPLLKRILKRGRAIRADSPPERLHELRIEIKRLRYQLEYLQEPYGEPLKQATRRLRKLQNTLGDHQDAMVAREQLDSYRRHHELGKRENKLFKHLLRLEAGKADQLHMRFFKDWKRFEREAKSLKKLFA